MNGESQPLLSICIPTFNRAALLRESLESILAQIDESNRTEVEIVISDNASTDRTGEVIAGLSRTNAVRINCSYSSANLGFDHNVLKVVDLAAGQYCWIFSDDDLLPPGALNKILDVLKRSDKIDLFYGEKADFWLTPDQPMRFRRIMTYAGEKIFDFADKRVVDDYFRRNKKLIAYCNYLSNIVFRRDKWARITNKAEFVGSKYIHMFVFQSMLWGPAPGTMKYLPLTLVKRRWGNDASYVAEERLAEDIKTYRRIAAAVFGDRKYARLIDEMLIRNDGFSWAVRLKLQDRQRFSRVTLPFLFRTYWDQPLFWLKIVPLVFLPNIFLMFLRGGYRRLVKGEPVNVKEILEAKS